MVRAPTLCVRCNRTAVRGAYCQEHRPVPFDGAKQRWAARRPGNYESLRRQAIRRAGGRCEAEGCESVGTDVDHINPVAEGGRWELDNFQLLCKPHHKSKVQEEALRGRQRRAA
ncbi:HNH endonuclease signature motif containing protein [Actinomadura oligospora]|uniref:HNH endonuclease signature motif containing protein n=1 Tax=Actinomadura oligospora TaxID=111804 RepID=UPI000A06E053